MSSPQAPPKIALRGPKRSGFTMVEVMVALLVLTVAVQILSSTVTASISYTRVKRERAAAVVATTNVIETMHSLPFYDLFATYDEDPDDDPDGPGTAPGARFEVDGLTPLPGQEFVGRIEFPTEGTRLVETVPDRRFGTPRDLNGDLLIDGDDRSGDYLVLPVVVTVEWTSQLGERRFEIATMFVDLEKEGRQ
ncbi:MAG: prepilin-type N-terminal cleavage/methylation domain-containing protein [Planctomycetota bacterium]|nr:prepilin-type N-terminal cleavage/methylation domain-containing protein [Planctomycetota bacterium]